PGERGRRTVRLRSERLDDRPRGRRCWSPRSGPCGGVRVSFDARRMPSAPVIARAPLVAACLLLTAAGCVRVQRLEPGVGGATGAGTPGPEVGGDIDAVWPARWGEGASGRKGVIVPEEEPLDGLYGIFLGEHHRFRPGPREYR